MLFERLPLPAFATMALERVEKGVLRACRTFPGRSSVLRLVGAVDDREHALTVGSLIQTRRELRVAESVLERTRPPSGSDQ